jgi:hypothetical protein
MPSAIAIALLVAAIWYVRTSSMGETVTDAKRFSDVGCGVVSDLFRRHRSGEWVTVSGVVQSLLGDTYGHFQHQRFILGCANGAHILVVNDVSIGQRVPLAVHGRVTVRGQYEWDSEGGLVHFTHRANGGGNNGWILYGSRIYQ